MPPLIKISIPRWLKSCFFYLIRLSFIILLISTSTHIIQKSLLSASQYEALSQEQGADQKVDHKLQQLWERLTFGLYAKGTHQQEKIEHLKAKAETAYHEATQWSLYFLWVASLWMVLHFIRWYANRKEPPSFHRSFLNDTIILSLIVLFVGLIAPVLSLTVHKDFSVIGKVVFKYEAKGILLTIAELYQRLQWFVASLILLFSVVIPILKSIAMLIAINSLNPTLRTHILKVLEAIGKWSMADVFVVALLLTFLAMDSDGYTHTQLGHGLYFFAAYCLLSLFIVSMGKPALTNKNSVDHGTKNQQDPPPRSM